MSDLEREGERRSKTKKSKSKKKSRGEKGAIQDISLPENFKEYGVPVDIGKRVITFSDVDKSVWEGVTELPYLPTPWNFILASMEIIFIHYFFQ